MTRKLTICDIAHLAGVSKSTVSRMLNDSVNVDSITREQVQRVVAGQPFMPDRTAMQRYTRILRVKMLDSGTVPMIYFIYIDASAFMGLIP